MKLKNHYDFLKKLLHDHPEYGSLDMIHLCDDGLNKFQKVYHNPVLGKFHSASGAFGEFDKLDEDTGKVKLDEVNSICIN
jgi:hypothetical protein